MENIGKFKAGVVVKHKRKELYGHVMSFTRNVLGELIIVVEWEDSTKPRNTHPNNLEIVNEIEVVLK